MGILLCEQNFQDVWIRNKSVRAEIGQILRTHTHTHTTAAKLVVRSHAHTHTHTTAAKLVVRIPVMPGSTWSYSYSLNIRSSHTANHTGENTSPCSSPLSMLNGSDISRPPRNTFISQRWSKVKRRECVGGGFKDLGEMEGVLPEAGEWREPERRKKWTTRNCGGWHYRDH